MKCIKSWPGLQALKADDVAEIFKAGLFADISFILYYKGSGK